MSYRKAICLVWPLAISFFVISFGELAWADDSPVQAVYVGTGPIGQGDQRVIAIRLTMENKRDKPEWIVLPEWGDYPLPKNGIFETHAAQPFGGSKFDGEGGSAIKVELFEGGSFRAFHIPGNGKIVLDEYSLEARKEVRQIDIIEADEIRVNNEVPLEQWLPFETLSGKDVEIKGSETIGGWKNLDWDYNNHRERTDYRKEKVKEVRLEGFQRWTVKF